MYKRIIVIALCFAVCMIVFLLGNMHVKRIEVYRDKIAFYDEIEQQERQWILESQLKNGAVLLYEGKGSVNPYFSNIAMNALLQGKPTQAETDAVKSYMQWYVASLNHESDDLENGAGTIYDYETEVNSGGEIVMRSKADYDSVDSYAATFLTLAANYVNETRDTEWVISNEDSLWLIIEALLRCMDTDGLTYTDSRHKYKYLMDNCEVNEGLKKAIELLSPLAVTGKQQDRVEQLKRYYQLNTASLKKNFWNSSHHRFEIGFGGNGDAFTFEKTNRLYPEMTAQLYPIVYRVIDADGDQAKRLYQQLSSTWKWEEFQHVGAGNDIFYWPLLAYTGVIMSDHERVEAYIRHYSEIVRQDRGYPLHVDDAAWIMMTCMVMKQHYQKKMFIPFY